jgi:DNA / pantothenate metabolism flavoprotein
LSRGHAIVLDKPAISWARRRPITGHMAVPLQPVAALSRPGPTPVVSAYREYRPAPAVTRIVACTWHGVAGRPRRMRLLPDGCLDLVWDGQRARAVRPAPRRVRRPVGESAPVIGIRIRPGWAAVVLGMPLRELPDVADLAGVWDRGSAHGLEAALAQTATPAAGRAVLTDGVTARLARGVLRVGFAAETDPDLRKAAAKLSSRGFDMLCLNDVSRPDAGFEVGTNELWILDQSGLRAATGLVSKRDAAKIVIKHAASLLPARP